MGKSLLSLTSFAGGIVSPKVSARADFAKYPSWQRQCQNMIPYRSGGLTRANGTQFIAACKYENDPSHNYAVRLMPFIFSANTEFMLEFGHHYIRFYSNGQQVMINSAPLWVLGTPYFPGTFVTDPLDGLIYFNNVFSGLPAPPSTNPAQWVQQNIYEKYTPYTADAGPTGDPFETDVFYVAPCQVNDVVYLAHPLYPPYKLTRVTDTNWTMEHAEFITPPLLDENTTDTVLAPTGLTDTTLLTATAPAWTTATYYQTGRSVQVLGIIYDAVISHTSSALFTTDLTNGKWVVSTIFRPQHVGSTWELSTLRAASFLEKTGVDPATGFTNGDSAGILCFGPFTVRTYGVWSADVAIQRSLDNGITWTTVYTVTSRSDNNNTVTGTGTTAVPALYRISVTNNAAPSPAGTTTPRIVFEVKDAFLDGLVRITQYLTPYTAIGQVVTQLFDNPASTPYWSEGAWSEYRGYPRAVAAYQQRIVYASSGYEPQRIWGTKTNDLENFDRDFPELADSGFAFDLNAPGRGPILWLIAQADLFAGFSGAEWVINSGSGGGPSTGGNAITATNINAIEQGTFGSAPNVQPAIVGNAVFFAQRQADSLRQMLFSVYTAKYMSQDMTTLADNLFAAGIAQIAYQSRWRHQGIIWVVTKQGTMCGLTYDLDQEVFGWCQRFTGYGQLNAENQEIPNDNGFESVSVLYANGTPDDEVWVVANRLIGGVQTRYIERVIPTNWEEAFSTAPEAPTPDLTQAFYVDSGLTITAPASLTLTGLDHLEGRSVIGLADGTNFGPLTVVGGEVELPPSIPTTVETVNIGLQIPYKGQPMRIDADPRAGNTQALVKQISDIYVRVYNSMGGAISNGTANYPTWISGESYETGEKVISPLTQLAYECVIATSGIVDPSVNVTDWTATTLPAWRQPVPIPYTPATANPFAVPVLVTVPTEIRIQPQDVPVPSSDPVFIVQGSDALPLTVLSLSLKYDVVSTP